MSNKNVESKSSLTLEQLDTLHRLEIATEKLQSRMSWKRKREASHCIFSALKEVVSEQLAHDVATAMTGIQPEDWRTAVEAMDDLSKLGVKVIYKTLGRLNKKANRAGGYLNVAFDESGRWESVDFSSLTNPVALLEIRVHGDTHFKVSAYQQNNGH